MESWRAEKQISTYKRHTRKEKRSDGGRRAVMDSGRGGLGPSMII